MRFPNEEFISLRYGLKRSETLNNVFRKSHDINREIPRSRWVNQLSLG